MSDDGCFSCTIDLHILDIVHTFNLGEMSRSEKQDLRQMKRRLEKELRRAQPNFARKFHSLFLSLLYTHALVSI